MKKFLLFIGVAVAATFVVGSANAQVQVGKGQLSGSLESNNIFYVQDDKISEPPTDPRKTNFGSNDYLKLDYTLDRFSAGIQIDGYLPGIYGYDIYRYHLNRQDHKRGNSLFGAFLTKYVQWEDSNWGVRVGDIYDQFGNGLILRAFEDRALGFNNAIAGARAHYNFNNYFAVKVLAGSPRFFDERSGSWVWGGDLSLSISDMAGWYDGLVSVEGSYVGRYQSNATDVVKMYQPSFDSNLLNMVSGRLNFEYAGFTLRGEYAQKLNKDAFQMDYEATKGNAIYVDLGYNYKRFSASVTFRRQEYMNTISYFDEICFSNAWSQPLNYLPLLTRQYTYSLANLNPYQGVKNGREAGGQIDLYYSLRNSKDRSKYWNFHANFSMFYQLATKLGYADDHAHPMWMDINVDVDRQWNRKFKTTFLYSRQQFDSNFPIFDAVTGEYVGSEQAISDIFVADMTYKFNKKHSVRLELQYLWDATNLYSTAGQDYEGDWFAFAVEYNFAPMFSFYYNHMWNCTDSTNGFKPNNNNKLHYYQAGVSWTYDRYRVQVSYGRNREGTVCSGGVCRFQPAYTGANISLTASF